MVNPLSSDLMMLPLKEIVLRKMVVILWCEPNILTSMQRLLISDYTNQTRIVNPQMKTLVSKITDKMSKLRIPPSLTKQMLPLVNPVGLQLRKWVGFHERYLEYSLGAPFLAKLCWTIKGMVDYRKTAEKIVRCEMMDIVKLYKLACLYCLEDYISVFWEELPEENKKEFYDKDTSDLQFCWPHILKGEQQKLNRMFLTSRNQHTTFRQRAFVWSAGRGNKAATEYFFQKLSYWEREHSLLKAIRNVMDSTEQRYCFENRFIEFPPEKLSETLYYLLTLNQEHQKLVFKSYPLQTLARFLPWPWQDHFMEVTHLVLASLSLKCYVNLLWELVNGKVNLPSRELFQELFTHSPVNFRNEFVNQESQFGKFFFKFFREWDIETIKVIFRNLDSADRMRVMSSLNVCKLFYDSIWLGKCHRVAECLREANLSKRDGETLKKSLDEFLTSTYYLSTYTKYVERSKLVEEQFFQLLGETNASVSSKRNLEVETQNKAKKKRKRK